VFLLIGALPAKINLILPPNAYLALSKTRASYKNDFYEPFYLIWLILDYTALCTKHDFNPES
jgi:hypothetical protein